MRAQSFLLEPLSPFRLDLTVWVLRRRPDNVVDRRDGHTYLGRGFLPTEAAPPQTGAGNHIDTRQKHTQKGISMKNAFKVGDHVEWNSEAGHVRGTIKKRVTSAVKFKTYTVRASKEEPQYLIKSDKTDHMAMHKGAALKKIGANDDASQKQSASAKKK